MLIGCPKEIKTKEFRVGLTPTSVREYVRNGHQVIVETNAGAGIQASDDDYIKAGAKIVATAKDVFDKAEMIVKVKEPQPVETAMMRKGQILFTYLHLAADATQAKGLIDSGSVAIAYETVTSDRGGLPLLAPMSEVAGRMGVHVGAYFLHVANGGSGILLGGVPGVKAAEVVIIGGGVAGTHSAKMAVGLEARVTIIEKSLDRIRYLEDLFGSRANIVYSTQDAVDQYVSQADLVIGAVLIPGALAPKLITKAHLKQMRPKSVIVDIAIDQGGCAETSKATTHDNPTYEVDGILHYCVANMPGAVPRTSAYALNNAVLPYGIEIANKGWVKALQDNKHLRNGLTVCKGKITQAEVARDLKLDYSKAEESLAA
ncbi:MAG: alanine dehydrogenase [Alphaproteobacteria bacterium]|jgi:alanine dehydrogenase|nr:alanine dehydrogenase [Alphaproteobacteria bacterium]